MRTLFFKHISGFIKNKLGVNTRARMLLTVRTHSFSWIEKSNEVNKDFKLGFHFDIHIYIKYPPLINEDKH